MLGHQLPLGNIQGLKKQINIYKKWERLPSLQHRHILSSLCLSMHTLFYQKIAKTKGSSHPWCWDGDSADDLSHASLHFIMYEGEKQIFRPISLDKRFSTRVFFFFFSPQKEHLALSKDIFDCPNVHTCVCRHTLGIQWVVTMDAAKHPIKHRKIPTTRTFPTPNVNRDSMINPALDSKSVAKLGP